MLRKTQSVRYRSKVPRAEGFGAATGSAIALTGTPPPGRVMPPGACRGVQRAIGRPRAQSAVQGGGIISMSVDGYKSKTL
jgi:hypothetical protein